MSTQHQHDELVKNIAVELSILLLEVWKANLTDYYLDTLHAPNGDKLYIEIARGRVHTSA